MIKEGKVKFNKDVAEKLSEISLNILEMIHAGVEELDLDEKGKILAHYCIIKNYMNGIENTMKDLGITDIMIEKIKFGLDRKEE